MKTAEEAPSKRPRPRASRKAAGDAATWDPAEALVLGVRHHGPGSARRLLAALQSARPSVVLIEGPSDLSDLLPALADPEMKPPIALLTYAKDQPARAAFLPFAAYSPELQAARWALAAKVPVRFMDLPAARRLALDAEDDAPSAEGRAAADPIGALARAAGYEDGESWWRDVVEETSGAARNDPMAVFAAVADAMKALREGAPRPAAETSLEAAREAQMRLEIAAAAAARAPEDGPVAAVCGAWHAPALSRRAPATADRAALRGMKKIKIAAAWVPWTGPRLAFASGYEAGVVAPGWCAHLWETQDRDDAAADALWLARIAEALRAEGASASTAGMIEAQRLAGALAALRRRPRAGFEELRDAAISVLSFGDRLLWDAIAPRLLLGDAVGGVPEGGPQAPLLADLQRAQKAARLKPEAAERELSLDLRTESGRRRSRLLRRLAILDAPWGQPLDPGGSRGTFRERWRLAWSPELAVRLITQAHYGATLAAAAEGRLQARLRELRALPALAEAATDALAADLPQAATAAIDALGRRAAATDDALELMEALTPLGAAARYGEARVEDRAPLLRLVERLAWQAAIALPHAARRLDAAAASRLRAAILAADAALAPFATTSTRSDATETSKAEPIDGPRLAKAWADALDAVAAHPDSAPAAAGLAARLAYEADRMDAPSAAGLLNRMLSPGRETAQAAGFFEGFFEGAGQRLLYDAPLRHAVDGWLSALAEDLFIAHLPLFRRVFSALDPSERRRLLEAVSRPGGDAPPQVQAAPGAEAAWAAALPRLSQLLRSGAPGAPRARASEDGS